MREKCIFHVLAYHSSKGESQGRSSRQEPEGRNWSRDLGGILLSGLLHMAWLQLRITCLGGGGTAHSGLGLPTLTINNNNNDNHHHHHHHVSTELHTGKSNVGNFSITIPSYETCWSLCQVEKTNQHNLWISLLCNIGKGQGSESNYLTPTLATLVHSRE